MQPTTRAAAGRQDEESEPFQPLLARTRTIHRSVDPVAYDCVRVSVVRDGSAFVFIEFGQKPVTVGDVVGLGANVLCGIEPEGHITVTTVSLDTDYVVDQVFWQYAGFLLDRLDAQDFAETIYTEPAQILRLGEDRAGMLMPWLDELVRLSVDGRFVENFYRMQALWFSVAHVITPFITGLAGTYLGDSARAVMADAAAASPVLAAAC